MSRFVGTILVAVAVALIGFAIFHLVLAPSYLRALPVGLALGFLAFVALLAGSVFIT